MSKMNLSAVTSRPTTPGRRFLVYGPPGVGKSTLAADAPSPIFLPVEEGVDDIDVPRFPRPESYQDVVEAVETLRKEKHSYKTLVLDTATALEGLVFRRMLDGSKWDTIERWDGGYNKWRQGAVDIGWRPLCARLDALRASTGMHVVLLGHSAVKPYKDPESEGWDRHTLQLEPLATGLLVGWVDVVLFAQFEDQRITDSGKSKGQHTGRRILRAEHSATAEAKNRLGLPPIVVMPREHPWAPLAAAMDGPSLEELRSQMAALTPKLDEATRAKVEAEVAKTTDRLRMRAMVEKVQNLVSKEVA